MPVQAPYYDALGERNGEVDLPDAIFGETPNMPVMHQAYLRQLANAFRGGLQADEIMLCTTARQAAAVERGAR